MINASYGAFHGSYSAFHRWRYNHLLVAAGGFCYADGDKRYFYLNDDQWPGLYALMSMSDSNGWLSPAHCKALAIDLEQLKPVISKQRSDGHLSDIESITQKFIDACLVAHEQGRKLYINKYDGDEND